MKLLIIAVFLITLSALFSAEIRDGQLFLEVHILEGKQINMSSQGSFKISEIGSPLSQSYNNKVRLSLQATETQSSWGLVNKTEEVPEEEVRLYPDDFIRDKFVWKDGKLHVIHERLVFEDKYFSSLEAVEKYANETGYPKKMIHLIPMQGASLKVARDNGSTDYFQLPVRVECDAPACFDSQDYSYDGIFIIKAAAGELEVNNLQSLEAYVEGVVPNEIGDTAHAEALKMQSVAVRTHAVSMLLSNKHLDDGYDLCNRTHCQVYKGNHLVGEKVKQAVQETNGIVLLFEGRIADAVYHSNCGGRTEANQKAWSGKPIPYLQGVACHTELDSIDLSIEANAVKWLDETNFASGMANWEKRSEKWERTINWEQLASNCGVANLHTMEVVERGFSGRITKLKLVGSNTVTLDGEWTIRQKFNGLPSSYFYVSNGKNQGSGIYALPENINIKGRGFGHGVGLCQVGALQKARAGWTWQDILEFYFPGTNLSPEWLQNSNNITEPKTSD